MKRRIKKIAITLLIVMAVCLMLLIVIIICVTSHELGHVLMAMFLKIPIVDWRIGIPTGIVVDTINATNFQMAMVVLGSFIFPWLSYIVLLISKKIYVIVFRIFIGISLYANIIISIPTLIIEPGNRESDIIQFQQYTNIDSRIIIGSLILVLIINIILELVSGRIKSLFLYIIEKI